MRFVSRAEFLAMPAGTIFAKVAALPTLDFGEVEIKGETVAGCDFYSAALVGWFETSSDTLSWFADMEAAHAGERRAVDLETMSRDGLFDEGQRFAVFDRDDARRLYDRIGEALREGYGDTNASARDPEPKP